MTPEAARLFFIASICFVLGGAAGVFATRTLYGDTDQQVSPAHTKQLQCPPPVPCPVCPPPPDCGETSLVPTGGEEIAVEALPELQEPKNNVPGLPSSALKLANAAVLAEVEPCLSSTVATLPGVALLDLVVTASAGVGKISEVSLSRATGGAQSLQTCLEEAAKAARFEWDGADGELQFKLPLRVGQ